MQFLLQPCHMVLAALVGWANERQQQIIEFQNDQIQAFRELWAQQLEDPAWFGFRYRICHKRCETTRELELCDPANAGTTCRSAN